MQRTAHSNQRGSTNSANVRASMPQSRTGLQRASRIALGAMLLTTGIGHLTVLRREFRAQVPDWVPLPVDDTVVYSGGAEIAITPMEFRLLKVFAENRGKILNRDQLLELAHDRGWDPFDRSIDIRISRLRKKIEQDPSKPEVIRTIRGVGYIYS